MHVGLIVLPPSPQALGQIIVLDPIPPGTVIFVSGIAFIRNFIGQKHKGLKNPFIGKEYDKASQNCDLCWISFVPLSPKKSINIQRALDI